MPENKFGLLAKQSFTLIGYCFALCTLVFGQGSNPPLNIKNNQHQISIGTGFHYRSFTGKLSQELDNNAGITFSLSLPYTKQLLVYSVCEFSLVDAPKHNRTLYLGKGGAALLFKNPILILPVLGLGVHALWARTQKIPEGPQYLLDDNEWEFGAFPLAYWIIPLFSKTSLQIGLQDDIIFTQPSYIHSPTAFLTLNFLISIKSLPWKS